MPIVTHVHGAHVEPHSDGYPEAWWLPAAKKAGRIAAEGVIVARSAGNVAVLIELNCETDFVAKDASFRAFGDKVADIALAGKIADVEVLKET